MSRGSRMWTAYIMALIVGVAAASAHTTGRELFWWLAGGITGASIGAAAQWVARGRY